MARELGMNPRKLGSLANQDQEPWKAPLPVFIADLYFKRFGKELPDEVMSIEDLLRKRQEKKEERKVRKSGGDQSSRIIRESDDPF